MADQNMDPQQPVLDVGQLLGVIVTLQNQILHLQQQQEQQQQQPQQHQLPVLSPIANQPQTSRYPKPDKPSAFTGRRGESVDSWLFQLEQYFNLTELPEDRQAFFAASFFKENAALWWQSWYRSLIGEHPQVTWTEFATAVRTQFRPVNAERIAREKLTNLRQTSSVAAYTHAFRTILLDLSGLAEADRLFAYIRGLKQNIAALVQVSNPVTVKAAARTAKNIDAVYWEHRPKALWASRPTRSTGPTPMELDSIRRTPLTESERANLRRTGGCFYCREQGHLAKDYPRKKRIVAAVAIEDQSEKEDSQ